MIEIIKTLAEMENLANSWDKLADACKNKSIFMTFRWNYAFARTILEEDQLFIVVIKEDDGLKAIAPFYLDRKALSVIGYPMSDYNSLLIPDPTKKIFKEILMAFKENAPDWRKIEIGQVDIESDSYVMLKKILDEDHYHFIDKEAVPCPILDYTKLSHEELRIHLNKKLVKRKINHMKAQGVFAFKTFDNLDDICKNLDILFIQHKCRWKKSVFKDEKYCGFYRLLAKELFHIGQFSLSAIFFDDKPISYILDFIYDDKVHSYTNTFDQDFGKFSPGFVIFKLDNDRFAYSLKEYNFGRGMEEYKLRYANRISKTRDVIIYRDMTRYLIRKAIESAKNILRSVRKNENLDGI